jgi:hypothetical protein
VEERFDAKKRKRAYLRAVGPDEGAPAHSPTSGDPESWTGASIRKFEMNFDSESSRRNSDDKPQIAGDPAISDVGTTPEEVEQQIEETLRGPLDRPFEDRQH